MPVTRVEYRVQTKLNDDEALNTLNCGKIVKSKPSQLV